MELSSAASARLAPWVNALREVSMPRSSSSEMYLEPARRTGVLWVMWPSVEELSALDSDTVNLAIEALEVLVLLQCAEEYDAWAAMLLHVWPTHAAHWLDRLPMWRAGGVRIGCKTDVETPGSLVPWATEFVVTQTSETTIERDSRLRSLIAEVFAVSDVASITQCAVPVHLGLCVNGAEEMQASAVLREATLVAQLQDYIKASTSGPGGVFSPRLRINGIWLLEDVAEDVVWCIDAIVSCGVRVTQLPMNTTLLSEDSAMQHTLMLQRIFASTVASSHLPGTTRLSVNSIMEGRMVASVFSALLDSRSIYEVDIFGLDGQVEIAATDVKVWQWLAVSVFSRQATNQLKRLVINVEDLTSEDIAAMEALIKSPNPVAQLFGNPNQIESTTTISTVQLSDATGEGPTLTLSEDGIQVRVVDDRRESWVGVLLPGYGRAWVPRSECEVVHAKVPTDRPSCAISEISLRSLDFDTWSSAVILLRVIGDGVTSLELHGRRDEDVVFAGEWYAEVLRACPNLDTLDIHRLDFDDLAIFSDAYDRGYTRMRQLKLDLVAPETARICDVLSDLMDESKIITKTLLNLSIVVDTPNDTLAEVQASLHQLLTSNYYLQDLTAMLRNVTTDKATAKAAAAAFTKYDGERVRGRHGPLPLTSKLGFLSVLTHPQHGDPSVQQAMSRADCFILARVFEYAAVSKTRCVRVAFKGTA